MTEATITAPAEKPAKTTAARKPANARRPASPEITTDRWTQGLSAAKKAEKLSEIRQWCRANGFPAVPDRGRIPQTALAAYAAHGAGSKRKRNPEQKEAVERKRQEEFEAAVDAAVASAPSLESAVFQPEAPEVIASGFTPETLSSTLTASGERPDWGDVPEGRDELLRSRDEERARADRLERELSAAIADRDAAQRSMVLALVQWARGQEEMQAVRRYALGVIAQANQASKAQYATARLRRVDASQKRRFIRRGR